ncbi:hypothetical protein [[Clostridium] colinum]|uniref:hypothetical protein n=1 Tax=[Clostridium] colinum TaxID=36835 RepID=UPI0020242E41|nr:hypothetical protein [[Clostridium] colinum]
MNIFRKIFQDKKNYYNILIAIFLGIMLLILSDNVFVSNKKENESIEYKGQSLDFNAQDNNTYEVQLEKRLESILSQIMGVGNVDVMIALESGREIVTKDDSTKENATTNEETLNGDKRQIITDKSQSTTVKISGDEPLILKEISPKISGVLIVAQGGGNVEIKNTLIEATNALLGVEVHKIEVLEMK